MSHSSLFKPTSGEHSFIQILTDTLDALAETIESLPRPVAGQDNIRTIVADIVTDGMRVLHALEGAHEAIHTPAPRSEAKANLKKELQRMQTIGDREAFCRQMADNVKAAYERVGGAKEALADQLFASDRKRDEVPKGMDAVDRVIFEKNLSKGKYDEAQKLSQEAERAYLIRPDVAEPLAAHLETLHTLLTGHKPEGAPLPEHTVQRRAEAGKPHSPAAPISMRVRESAPAKPSLPIELGAYDKRVLPTEAAIDETLDRLATDITSVRSRYEPDEHPLRASQSVALPGITPFTLRPPSVSSPVKQVDTGLHGAVARMQRGREASRGADELTLPQVIERHMERLNAAYYDLEGPRIG